MHIAGGTDSTSESNSVFQSLTCQNDAVARPVLCPTPGTRTSLVARSDSTIKTGHITLPVSGT
jgi:hypothetical protein